MKRLTYLLNLDVYARSDASPNPELNDVSTMPKIAIHSVSAYATRRNPASCKAIAKNIRILKQFSKTIKFSSLNPHK